MKIEINLSENYRRDNIRFLHTFSKYNKNKPFQTIIRDDLISFPVSYRRPEAAEEFKLVQKRDDAKGSDIQFKDKKHQSSLTAVT